MKHLYTLILLSSSLSLAQTYTLSDALKRSESMGSVKLAALEVKDATQNLERVQADPLLTRPSEVQAKQRLANAQVKYSDAIRQAESQIASAYVGVLDAGGQVRLAEKSQDIADSALKITQIRLKNGSATRLDVQDAERSLADTKKNVASAENGYALSQQSLKNLIGNFEKLTAIGALPELPQNNILDTLVSRSPSLLQVNNAVELAQMQLDLLDPSYSPQSQIDSAKSGIEQATQNLADLKDNLRLQMQSSFDNVQSAYKSLSVQQQARKNSAEQLSTQQQRLKSGLISPFDVQQTELRDLQAELGYNQARHQYLKAWFALQAGSR